MKFRRNGILKRQRFRLIRLVSRLHRWVYQLSRGKAVGKFGKCNFLLLTTTGRRTERSRTVPLLYLEEHGAYALVASYGGNPLAPAWLLNIRADPQVKLQIGGNRIEGVAWIAGAQERARLWVSFVAVHPGYDKYQAVSGRRIPVVLVQPRADVHPVWRLRLGPRF